MSNCPLSLRGGWLLSYDDMVQEIIIKKAIEMDRPTYTTTKEIRILHNTDDWDYTFTADEYGTVCVTFTEGLEAMTGTTRTIPRTIHIPKECIQHFINTLEQFK